MTNKFQILDEYLDMLDEVNNSKFASEKFKEANSQIENILIELKSNEQIFKNNASKDYKDVIKNLLSKIEILETKILPKANLLASFSKSKS